MSGDSEDLAQIVAYMRAHWPSQVKKEWQVEVAEYEKIAKKVVLEWSKDATFGGEFVRITGQSGSGKTSQLLPAVEEYFKAKKARPVLVAARKFVEYHPHFKEIVAEYGEKDLRKMTDEFATIMMFLVIKGLISLRCDLILDVTLLDPKMEAILMKMLLEQKYSFWMSLIAVSPEITARFLEKREWRHTKETEEEFVRATQVALEFYANNFGEMNVVMWNVWSKDSIFDGKIKDALKIWRKYMVIDEIPEEYDEAEIREAKKKYFKARA
ncbi:zeta toxin family protein [Candidatus Saccharibacteria bacterium]|nr:zeta toxin family protein [Candidatus Saccharibacteria bacterium]